jgi:outer membrane protein assembly factor BamA
MTSVRIAAGLLFWVAQASPAADAWPPIRQIAYEGNEITRPVTMQRELVVAIGDPADPEKLERSRQAIQDLGLFREVKLRQEALEDGVRVVFTVREKWYVIPIPRLEANSDGDTGYGLQLRWNNVWGLNHRWALLFVQRDYKRQDRDDSTNFFTSYDVPFVGNSRNSLSVSGSYIDEDSVSPEDVEFRERRQSLGLSMSHAFGRGPASQGWKIGAGLRWQNQEADGFMAPAAYGTATGPVLSLSYNGLHDHLYSQTGESFSTLLAGAQDGIASDYSFWSHYSRYRQERRVGQREHQTLRFRAELGGYHGGPASRPADAFEYGGSSQLRGYERERIEGDLAYYASADFLRPVGWNWLRLLTSLELGSALDDISHADGRLLYASLGLGVSVKLTWFVNVEFEAGIAYPLIDGDGLRVFVLAI